MLGQVLGTFAEIGRQCFNFLITADLQIAIKKQYSADDNQSSPRSTPTRLRWEAAILEKLSQASAQHAERAARGARMRSAPQKTPSHRSAAFLLLSTRLALAYLLRRLVARTLAQLRLPNLMHYIGYEDALNELYLPLMHSTVNDCLIASCRGGCEPTGISAHLSRRRTLVALH